MILVACDPGVAAKKLALAAFIDGALVDVARLEGRDLARLARDVRAWARWYVDEVVVEVPVVRRGRARPADLVALAVRAGAVIGALAPLAAVEVAPEGWKGQRPKAIDHARTRSVLTARESALVGSRASGDVLDAVGIGLWRLRR